MESGTAVAASPLAVDGDLWESAFDLDDESLVAELGAVETQITRLEAARAALISEADRRGLPARDGYGSTTGWLTARNGDQPGINRSRVKTARALRHMPVVREAFTSGDLTEPRVRVLVDARDTEPVVFARDESLLVSQAHTLTAIEFRQAITYWQRLADHQGFLRHADRAFTQRSLHASVTWAGIVRIDGQLDPEAGATLLAALHSLTDPHNLDPQDTRTPTQRRADALTELARRHLDNPDRPTIGGDRPHLIVHLDLDTLQDRAGHHCDLNETGPITPEAARRLACDAKVTRIITGPQSQPLDIGRTTRVIPPAIRRALHTRDQHCTHPGCTTPATWCDAHHITHWANGGPTRLDNLQLLCRRHHRHAHQRE